MSLTRLCYQLFSFFIVSHDLHDSIAINQKELGVGPCLAADIWGENGISLLGVLGYWVDISFVLHEKLLMYEPFSEVCMVAKNLLFILVRII
jgi:hypothetical protein